MHLSDKAILLISQIFSLSLILVKWYLYSCMQVGMQAIHCAASRGNDVVVAALIDRYNVSPGEKADVRL